MKLPIKHPKLEGVILTKHHLRPKSRLGVGSPQNRLKIWSHKHKAWHFIFKQLTLEETIANLQLYRPYMNTKEWRLLFKEKSFIEIVILLVRVATIKRNIKKRRVSEVY